MVIDACTWVIYKIRSVGGPLDTLLERNKNMNPLKRIPLKIIYYGLLFLLCLPSVLFVHIYYFILNKIYRYTFDVDIGTASINDKIQWCEENNLKFYNFIPFHENSLLEFIEKQRYYIGFRTKEDAIAFKLQWS